MSPTVKPVPRIDALWRSMIHTGAKTAEKIGSRRLRKSMLFVKRYFTLPPAHKPSRRTHSPSVEESYMPELDWLATSTPKGPTNHEIIIIEECICRHHRKRWRNNTVAGIYQSQWCQYEGSRRGPCEVFRYITCESFYNTTQPLLRLVIMAMRYQYVDESRGHQHGTLSGSPIETVSLPNVVTGGRVSVAILWST